MVSEARDQGRKGTNLVASPQFRAAEEAGAKAVDDPAVLKDIADSIERKTEDEDLGKLEKVVAEVKTLGRLLAAFHRGDYTDIDKADLALAAAGLIYVLLPWDLVPEGLIGPIGYVDDAVVISWVVKAIRQELGDFNAWEESQEGGAEGEAPSSASA